MTGLTPAHYGDPLGEQRALAAGRAAVPLAGLGVVRVGGPDRLSWLHSLTTQSLASLEPGESTEALILSPKGRIEHAFACVDDGSATWLICESAVQAVALAAWLDGMRFARRVDVSDISGEYDAVADLESDSTLASPGIIIWRDPWPVVADGSTRYGPPADEHPGEAWNLRLALLPRGSAESAISNAGLALAGASALDALRIAACRPVFSREVDASSIPHELDWLRTAVHLRKGCYRGQEAVAHVHNLGRPPRRLVLLHLDGSAHEIPEPGSAVCLAATGETVGRLTSSAMHHELGPIGLAVIRRTTPEGVAMMVGENTSASAETVVNTDGTTPDRPAPRGPLTRGLMAPTRSMPAAGGASVRIFGAKP